MGLIKGVVKVIEIIYREAEKEYYSEEPYMDALNELFNKLSNGEITEKEYEEEEKLIIDELKVIREYRKNNGLGDE